MTSRIQEHICVVGKERVKGRLKFILLNEVKTVVNILSKDNSRIISGDSKQDDKLAESSASGPLRYRFIASAAAVSWKGRCNT